MKPALFAAAAALLLPLPALAQDGPPAGRGNFAARLLVEESSIDFLLTKSAELKLTPELTAQFQQLDAKFEEQAKPLREQIRAKLPTDPAGDREAMRAVMQEVRPTSQQLRELDQKFAADAIKLLPADAQATANSLLEQRRPARAPRPGS